MNAGELKVVLKLDDGKFNASLIDAEGNVKSFGGTTEKTAESSKRSFGIVGAAAVAAGSLVAVGITKIISTVSDMTGEIITASDSMEKFASTMGFAGFDSGVIKSAKKEMKTYADQTVFGLNDVMNTTAQLAANGISDYTKLTQAAGNLTAVAGGGADAFKSVAMMLTQTAGAGKLTTENWNQLTDAIPGASGRLKDAMLQAGAYTGNFREAMEKGEITAGEFNQAILELGSEPVAVEAAKSTKTFEGALGQLQATVVNLGIDIIEAIGKDNIANAINSTASGVAALGNILKTTIPKAIDYAKDFYDWMVKWKDVLILIAAPILAAKLAFDLWMGAIAAWQTAVKIATGVQVAFNAVMSANPIMIIIMAIAALVAGLVYFFTQTEIGKQMWQGFVDFMVGAWDTITGAVSTAIDWVKANWPLLLAILSGPIGLAVYAIVRNFDSIKAAFQLGWNFITGLWGQAGSFFGKIFDNIKGAFASIPDVGRDLVMGLWNGIGNMAGWIKSKIEGFGGDVLKSLKSFFGIHSPSRVMRDEIGKMLGLGVGDGITESIGQVLKDVGTFNTQVMDAIGITADSDVYMSKIEAPAEKVWQGSSGNDPVEITQNVYPQTPVDMNIINRSLMREARRA